MSDTSYWPEVLVDELRNVVRESKFDFIAASEKLSKWWLSNESNVTAADRGMDISGIDKATIEITSASVRVNFARDYKDAPFKTAVVSSVSQETKTISPKATASTDVSSNQNQDLDSATNTIIELAEDDDAFNFDSVEGEINNISNNENTATGEGEEKSSFSFTSTTNELATSTNLVDVDDLTYEELMEKLEKQEEANFKRKEEIFQKVAKALLMEKYTGVHYDENGKEIENGENADVDMNQQQMELASNIMNKKKFMSPVDQEVQMAYAQGIEKRRNKKLDRENALREQEEARELKAQREALRRRFDPDSEDMQGDAFEFQFKSDITSPSSARQELESALQGSTAVSDGKASRHPPVDLVKIANDTARVLSAARSVRPVDVVGAEDEDEDELDLSLGPELDDILTSLEEEFSMQAQNKGAVTHGSDEDDSESDLAQVLRVLDEAAKQAKKGLNKPKPKAINNGDGNANNANIDDGLVGDTEREKELLKQKQILKSGFGIETDTRNAHNANRSMGAPINGGSRSRGAHGGRGSSVGGRGGRRGGGQDQNQDQAKTGAGAVVGSGGGAVVSDNNNNNDNNSSNEEDEDDDDDESDDDDDAWNNRRKAAKQRAGADTVASGGVDTEFRGKQSVYGFAGSHGVSYGVSKAPAATKVMGAPRVATTTERASDRTFTSGKVDGGYESPKVGQGSTTTTTTTTPVSKVSDSRSSQVGMSMSISPSSPTVDSPGIDNTWNEVLTPPQVKESPSLPSVPEPDERTTVAVGATPTVLPPKAPVSGALGNVGNNNNTNNTNNNNNSTGGLKGGLGLGGALGGRSRAKGKGGKLMSVTSSPQN